MTDERRYLDYLKRTTVELRQARRRVRELEDAAGEPIAVVGMGCRFPGGVGSPEELWALLDTGGDAMGEFPADRGWDLEGLYDPDGGVGASYVRQGGFLHEAGHFDPGFFGMSPREALATDPQQRLALMTSWEAFERAGIDPGTLRGSPVGVFLGAAATGYASSVPELPDGVHGHLLTGTSTSVVSGRVAFSLGLKGPALTVDTACSSSLVALHLAARSLRGGDCTLALAGGVTVMPTPGMFQEFSRQRGLAADGRCKAFADAADGTGWSEGAGVLVLERLSDAERAGHPVLAVLRGTAVNSDGASNGLTAPNGPAQRAVIVRALDEAGLTADEVDVVEAHGTGTELGDPIEAQALIATYGRERSGEPLLLGSVKSNLGHTQAAAGVAGVIKLVLAIGHGRVPGTLHVDRPSRHVDWDAGRVELATTARDWPDTGRPRIGAVSSFGISGTNAHVIVGQPPADIPPETPAGSVEEPATETGTGTVPDAEPVGGYVPLLVSARTEAALRDQAARLRGWLAERPDTDPAGLADTLATTRAAFEHRAAVLATDRAAVLDGLAALAGGTPSAHVVTGSTRPGRTAFLFSGQGAQRPGAGRGLAAAFGSFDADLDTICAGFDAELDRPLRAVLDADPGTADAELLDRTRFTQPALFAVEVALHRLCGRLGLVPDLLLGHSVGEIAAAHVAGVFDLADATRLVAARGRLMDRLPGGAMAALAATPDEVGEVVRGHDGVAVAAVNGPEAVVVSGDPDAVDAVAAELAGRGRRTRRLRVGHAFHSPHMDPMLDEFARVAESLTYHRPRTTVVSALTGRAAGAAELTDPGHWVRHVREPVLFADAVTAAAAAGASRLLELGPDAVLTPMVRTVLDAAPPRPDAAPPVAVPSLVRDRDEQQSLLAGLAALHAAGRGPDWTRLSGRTGRPRPDLPTYAFQLQRFWLEHGAPAAPADTAPDPADEAFWDVVARHDVDSARVLLDLDPDAAADADADAALGQVLPVLSRWHRARRAHRSADGLRYTVGYAPVAVTGAAPPPGHWLTVLPDEGTPGAEAARRVHDALAAVMTVTAVRAAAIGTLGERIAAEGPAGVVSLLSFATAGHPDGHGAEPTADPSEVPPALTGTLALLQALAAAGVDTPTWHVTAGALAVTTPDDAPDPERTAVWGLCRTAAVERPQSWAGLLDLPAGLDERALRRLPGVLGGDGGAGELAVRDRGLFERRVERARPGAGSWTPAGTVLVTGGTGALGSRVARGLAGPGVRLVLLSRRGPDAPGAAELTAELAGTGAEVELHAADVTDRDALAAVLDDLDRRGHGLDAVVHTAGVLEDGVLDTLTPQRLAAALAPKLGAARHLDALTRDRELSAFVVFSSFATTFGSAGQAAYTAANAALNGVALARRAAGLPATSIAWGPWAESGMAADDRVVARLARAGFTGLDADRALSALRRAVASGEATPVVADIDWDRYVDALAGPVPTPLTGLPEVRRIAGRDTEVPERTPAGAWLDRLAGLDERDRRRELTDRVRGEIAAVLGYGGPADVPAGNALSELGLDSLTAVELRNRLAAATGLTLPSGLVFDHPTAAALAGHLLDALAGAAAPEAAAVVPARPDRAGDGDGDGDDPVVIVGMGCRFPGGIGSPEQLWRFLAEGGDAIGPAPTDRGWSPDTAGARGGFLHDATDFDAEFFGISPREALAMDPQQRLLLETVWEACEHAGIDPSALRGTDAGVFAGTNGQDYAAVLAGSGTDVTGHGGIGTAAAVFSGRISYALGLEGPSITVDTACSSSLVALHWAARSLRAGECSLAFAGGATVMSTGGAFTEFAAQGGLAADGRCKAFGAGADGTSWAEGVGVVVLARASAARRHGHRVLAVLRGSAVNSDGASNGLTAPNGVAQQRVIRAALADAGLGPADVDVVEAHGTGTKLGDPIEAHALRETYGRAHPTDRPLLLGSVKSNLGHTQAAAGVAGVIKTVLALGADTVPATLHADPPTPELDWADSRMRPAGPGQRWPERDAPRRAAVSAFGVSGTNAHVLLEQPAPPEPAGPGPAGEPAPAAELHGSGGPAVAWLLAARGETALAAQAARLDAALRCGDATPGATRDADPAVAGAHAVARSLATTRATRLPARAVVVGTGREVLHEGVAALGRGEPHPAVLHGTRPDAPAGDGRIGMLFTGQGSQRAGMGRVLAAREPVFAAALDGACAALDEHLDHPLREVMWDDAGPLLAGTDYTQAAIFAVEVALAALWRSWGVLPDVVLGHSIGELAAAHVAGVFDLADAARLVTARGRLMQQLPAGGAMVSVQAPEALVRERLAGTGVDVAAVNGPSAVVLSGAREPVLALAETFAADGHRTRRLQVARAFHSSLTEPVLDPLRAVAAGITYREPSLTVVSTRTGGVAGPETLTDPEHWVRQVRDTVHFADGVRAAAGLGLDALVEVGPDSALAAPAQETLGAEPAGRTPAVSISRTPAVSISRTPAVSISRTPAVSISRTPAVVVSLRADTDEHVQMLRAAGGLHVAGIDVDWARVLAAPEATVPDGNGAGPVRLPTYAFRPQRFWPEPAPAPAPAEDGGFWAAVDAGDTDGLADELDLHPDAPLREVVPTLARRRRDRRGHAELEQLRYRVEWTPVTAEPAVALSGTWLLVVPEDAGADGSGGTGWSCGGVAQALADLGARVRVVGHRAGLDRAGLVARITGEGGEPGGIAGVVSLLGVRGADRTLRTVELVHALDDAAVPAPLWLVTAGAVEAGGEVTDPHGHQLWGFGAALALERPDRWGGLVDLPSGTGPAGPDPRSAVALATVVGGAYPANQLAVRAAGVLARRLARSVPPVGARPWTPSGTVLVTGGTGALGSAVARRLAARGAQHLVLTGRRGAAAPGAAELVAELTAGGTTVTVEACDVTDRDSLSAVLDRIPADRPLTGVVHAAGVLADGTVDSLTADTVHEVLRVKVEGARLLDELTAGTELAAFVLFSSLAGTVGAAGQANYAAANAHLDALAATLRSRGRAATSIAWGPWQGEGMAGADVADRMRRGGVVPLPVDTALSALELAAGGGEAAVVVADVEWQRYGAGMLAGPHRALVAQLPELRELATAGPVPDSDGLADLAALPGDDQERLLRRLVRTRVAAVLGHGGGERISDTTPFRELGFDSLTAIELRNVLAGATGLALPATVAFDRPSVADLADHLRAELVPAPVPDRDRLASEIDRLAAELTTVADADRDHLIDRLRAVLGRPAAEPAEPGGVDTADAEELYALIDGRPQI